MKISLNWLKKYIDVKLADDALVEIFTLLGFEVENVETIGLRYQKSLVVGEIRSIIPHPNADKLSICQVCVGDNDTRQIVCGAKNFKLMDHVPVALPGTVLPGEVVITENKLREVLSCGMMCSGRELGLGGDHSGLLILDSSTKVGTVLHDAIDVQNDTIFDLSITSNRGDCLSYQGIARELGCKLNIPFKLPMIDDLEIKSQKKMITSINVDSNECICYHAFCISGVKVQKSPDWLVRDLQASGIKSVNNVVDICNWVMLETGHPLHAFDIKKIKNNELTIRRASNNESLLGLGGKQYFLNDRITIIADTERPLVIAGIIGGADAEIDDSSADILIEAACFDFATIMYTSRMLNLATDSSYRFARIVDGETCVNSGKRAVKLITEICGGQWVQYLPAKKYHPKQRIITITDEFIAKKLGFTIEHKIIHEILSRLGFGVQDTSSGFVLNIPSFRSDIERPIDIVEECLRIYGTDKLPSVSVNLYSIHRTDHRAYTYSMNTRSILSTHGFLECYNYSLISSEIVKNFLGTEILVDVQNPLSSDQACYRQSLLPGLLETLKFNIQNGNFDSKFFEIGKLAVKVNNKINEYLAISFIALENSLARSVNPKNVGFEDIKYLCFDVLKSYLNTDQVKLQMIGDSNLWQPGYSAEYSFLDRSGLEVKCGLLKKHSLNRLYGIKHNVWGAEIIIADSVFSRKLSAKTYKSFSQFPRIIKDISIVVNRDEQAGEVKYLLEKFAKKSVSGPINIEYVSLFDVYTGEHIDQYKKALGFEISFRSNERTLTDEEVKQSFGYIQNEISKIYEIRKIS